MYQILTPLEVSCYIAIDRILLTESIFENMYVCYKPEVPDGASVYQAVTVILSFSISLATLAIPAAS